MTPHFKSLMEHEKILLVDIMKLERSLNFDQLKINEALPRIAKLEKNYINVFRTKNPDFYISPSVSTNQPAARAWSQSACSGGVSQFTDW